MVQRLGFSMFIVAVLLSIAHYFIGFQTKLGDLAGFFLGTHVTYAAGSFIVEFILYLVFFFLGVWGLTMVAGGSKS